MVELTKRKGRCEGGFSDHEANFSRLRRKRTGSCSLLDCNPPAIHAGGRAITKYFYQQGGQHDKLHWSSISGEEIRRLPLLPIDTSLRIITDLLDFARTRPPQFHTVTAWDIIDENLSRCTLPDNVELRDEVPVSLPPLMVDPLQIGQVLQNLIVNGVQAIPT